MTPTCARCGRELEGDTVHSAALLMDLAPDGAVVRFLLCRDYRGSSGRMVKGCANRALTPAAPRAGRKDTDT